MAAIERVVFGTPAVDQGLQSGGGHYERKRIAHLVCRADIGR